MKAHKIIQLLAENKKKLDAASRTLENQISPREKQIQERNRLHRARTL